MIAGTLAVHLILAVVIDAVSVVWRPEPKPQLQKLRFVNIDDIIPDPPPPPEPEVATPELVDTPPVPQPEQPRMRTPRSAKTTPQAKSDTPPTPQITPPAGGSGPVVNLPGIAPAARGVAAGSGQPTRGRLGRGGDGTGSGSGSGAGVGSATAPVVATSVASIKTPAEAKEGFDYFDARKSYPAEAKRLGVEGKLRVRLLVDAGGKVTQAKLLGSLGHGLDELALARARAIEFVPAKDSDDKAVASVVVWTFTFTLPSDT
ncbi:MAG TPA: energy transducer TonB [Kofleriaceae bacterium]|nr:energy transducer TonB [Kofleriaceae bacterium]